MNKFVLNLLKILRICIKDLFILAIYKNGNSIIYSN